MQALKVAGMIAVVAAAARAGVPEQVNYQGRLVNGTNLVNGQVSLVLEIYDGAEGGARLYADSNTVTVVDGLYSTFIGDDTVAGTLTGALASAEAWLQVTVNGTALMPRERLASAAYALSAAGAASLSGALPAAQLTGTLDDARLSANVARLNSSPTFAGTVRAAGFAGNGAGLTNLDLSHVSGHTMTIGRDWGSGILQVYGSTWTQDQQQVSANSSFFNPGSRWESFTAGFNGDLAGVEAYLSSYHERPWTATLKIFQGEWTNGPLLAAQTVGSKGGPMAWFTFALSTPVPLVRSNQYTFCFENPTETLEWRGINSDVYPGGRGDWSYAADYCFRTWMVKQEGVPALVVEPSSLYVGIGTDDPTTTLDVRGRIFALAYEGNGWWLSNLNITNLAGTLPDARLAANVARLNINQTFTGAIMFPNAANAMSGTFSGNGAGLTNVNADLLDGQHGSFYQSASNLTGTLPDGRLSANVARRDTTNAFAADQQFSGRLGIGVSPARELHVRDVMRLEPRPTAPAGAAAGDMYFDSTLNRLRVYDGTTWQNCW